MGERNGNRDVLLIVMLIFFTSLDIAWYGFYVWCYTNRVHIRVKELISQVMQFLPLLLLYEWWFWAFGQSVWNGFSRCWSTAGHFSLGRMDHRFTSVKLSSAMHIYISCDSFAGNSWVWCWLSLQRESRWLCIHIYCVHDAYRCFRRIILSDNCDLMGL